MRTTIMLLMMVTPTVVQAKKSHHTKTCPAGLHMSTAVWPKGGNAVGCADANNQLHGWVVVQDLAGKQTGKAKFIHGVPDGRWALWENGFMTFPIYDHGKLIASDSGPPLGKGRHADNGEDNGGGGADD